MSYLLQIIYHGRNNMKKIYSLILINFIFIGSIFSTPTIKGDFTLSNSLNFDNNFDTTFSSSPELNLYLNSSSNNVKYTIKNSIKYLNDSELKNATNFVEQAYLKFRIPYKDNYLIFNFGKTPLDIGGDWVFNSGTPFNSYIDYITLTKAQNPWIASVKHKLYQNDKFQSLNLEIIAKLPVEYSDKKIGGRLTYDINNQKFGTLETSILTNKSESIISGGINGTLYFDYGIYGKIDLQEFNDFEGSIYLLKLIDDYTIKLEALYDNELPTYFFLSTLSYNLNPKTNINGNLKSIYANSQWTLTPSIYLNQNIVQGLDSTLSYVYSKEKKHFISFSITHKF